MNPPLDPEVEAAFTEALELPSSERAAFLTREYESRPELRAEVESLLRAHQAAGSFLEPGGPPPGGSSQPQPGAWISSYQILGRLGGGGMGEVFRAQDTRLRRSVAIKFLSAEIANETGRRRFQREAQTASSLNHPHILTVYEVGEIEGRQYLVTEFIDGCDLRDWARKTQPSVRQITDLLIGIADGLACAHEAGIVHRDVKPENILVSKNGYAKLVDFGLAKLLEPPDASGQETKTPNKAATRPGVVIGTVAYMSPEQAAGRPIDARSDIFAFGVVLYELLAGERPFAGHSDVDVLHAVLHKRHRPLVELRPDAPVELRIAVEKALEKDPADRYQAMREIVVDLKRAQRSVRSDLPLPTVSVRPRRGRRTVALSALALLVVLLVSAYLLYHSDFFWRNPMANATFTRLTDFEGTERDADISADGRFIVFLSDRDGPFDAWIHQLGTGEFVNLTKGRVAELMAEACRNVQFAGDGAQVWVRVARREGGRLTTASVWQIPTIGGVLRPFLEDALEPASSPDRSRIVYHGYSGGDSIFLADRNGSNARKILAVTPGVHCHFQTWSPDGRYVYFVKGIPSAGEWDIWRIPAAGGSPERITHHNSRVGYPTPLDNRTLLYTAPDEDGVGSRLYTVDVERRIPHRVSFGLEQYISLASSAASNGRRRLIASVANPSANLWSVPLSDRVADESSAARLPVSTVRAVSPRFGPDYIAYLSSRGGADGLWKWSHGVATELWNASEGPVVAAPAISPDGAQICFSIRKEGRTLLHLISASGTNLRSLAGSLNVGSAASWSPDGKWIAVSADEGSGPRIFNVPVDGGMPVRLTEENSSNPVWSPNGRFILYTGPDENGVFPLRAVTPAKQVYDLPQLWLQREGGEHFCFLNDGAIVVQLGEFMNRQGDFWSFDLVTGRRRQLTRLRSGFSVRSFDVSPDGKQILFDRTRENADIVLIDLTG